MSRVSVLAIPLISLFGIAATGPAQDKEKVLRTVQKLESRLDQVDRYFRGLQSSESGAMQAEIVSMQKALAETRDQYAEQVAELMARNQQMEQGLAARTAERDTARESLASLATQLEESQAKTRDAEQQLQALRAQADEAVDRANTAEVRTRAAEDEAARLTAELADAILEDQARERERQALAQRAEDASASLAAEQDRVAQLEYELEALRAAPPEPDEALVAPTILQVPTSEGIQIHVHGGEATFHIHGAGLPLLPPPAAETEPAGDPNLRLRLRQDGVSNRSPTVAPRTLPPKIHLF